MEHDIFSYPEITKGTLRLNTQLSDKGYSLLEQIFPLRRLKSSNNGINERAPQADISSSTIDDTFTSVRLLYVV